MTIYPYMKHAIRAVVVFLIGWGLILCSYGYDIEYTTKILRISGYSLIVISALIALRAIKKT
jgi:hypothetical protein